MHFILGATLFFYLIFAEINTYPRLHIISLLPAEYITLKAIIPLREINVFLVYILFSPDLNFFFKYDLLQLPCCI